MSQEVQGGRDDSLDRIGYGKDGMEDGCEGDVCQGSISSEIISKAKQAFLV